MIYVTRPSPEGEVLTQLLNQANLPAIHLPLFDMLAGKDLFNLQIQLNRLLPNDIVIVVSPQVINVIKSYIPNLIFPNNLRYFAIGKKSAELLSQLTQTRVDYPRQEDSEGLLELLASKSVNNYTVLILKGNVGRQLIAETLSTKQAQIKLIECYSRNVIPYQQDILYNDIEKQILIVTSIAHLHQLEIYCKINHKKNAILVVTSQRIFEEAKQQNWQKIVLVTGANNQILFKTLITLCHNDKINLNNTE